MTAAANFIAKCEGACVAAAVDRIIYILSALVITILNIIWFIMREV